MNLFFFSLSIREIPEDPGLGEEIIAVGFFVPFFAFGPFDAGVFSGAGVAAAALRDVEEVFVAVEVATGFLAAFICPSQEGVYKKLIIMDGISLKLKNACDNN